MDAFALRNEHPHIAPWKLVHVRVDTVWDNQVSLIGEVVSFPDENGNAFVRLIPGEPGTYMSFPVQEIHPLDLDVQWQRRMATEKVSVSYASVAGSGSFPVDMLRYDSCWPINFNITRDEDRGIWVATPRQGERLLIVAKTSTRPWTDDPMSDFTKARWSSFNWGISGIRKLEV